MSFSHQVMTHQQKVALASLLRSLADNVMEGNVFEASVGFDDSYAQQDYQYATWDTTEPVKHLAHPYTVKVDVTLAPHSVVHIRNAEALS